MFVAAAAGARRAAWGARAHQWRRPATTFAIGTPLLLCKPSADGTAVGDCPFTHYARMAMEIAGKPYEPRPTKPDDKPKWHLDEHKGSMPCLAPNGFEDGAGAVSESAKIASEALPPTEADAAAMDAMKSFFPAIAKFIKNTDAPGEGADAELRAGLREQLGILEGVLKASGTPFLAGESPGLSDASVATKLYVLATAGKHYKAFELNEAALPAVAAYRDRVFAHPSFAETKYAEADALAGWGAARGGR